MVGLSFIDSSIEIQDFTNSISGTVQRGEVDGNCRGGKADYSSRLNICESTQGFGIWEHTDFSSKIQMYVLFSFDQLLKKMPSRLLEAVQWRLRMMQISVK